MTTDPTERPVGPASLTKCGDSACPCATNPAALIPEPARRMLIDVTGPDTAVVTTVEASDPAALEAKVRDRLSDAVSISAGTYLDIEDADEVLSVLDAARTERDRLLAAVAAIRAERATAQAAATDGNWDDAIGDSVRGRRYGVVEGLTAALRLLTAESAPPVPNAPEEKP